MPPFLTLMLPRLLLAPDEGGGGGGAPVEEPSAAEGESAGSDELDIDSLDVDEDDLPPAPDGDDAGEVEDEDEDDVDLLEGEDERDPFNNKEVEQFDRSYVQRLRRQGAAARVKARELEETVQTKLVPGIGNAFVDLFLGDDDAVEAATAYLERIYGPNVRALAEEARSRGGASAPAEEKVDENGEPLTPEKVRELAEKAIEERQRKEAQEAEQRRITEFLTENGLGPAPDGTPHPHTQDILNRMIKGGKSVEEAVAEYRAEVEAYEAAIERRAIEKLVARKKADREKLPKVPDGEAGSATGGLNLDELDTPEARRRAAEALVAARKSRR